MAKELTALEKYQMFQDQVEARQAARNNYIPQIFINNGDEFTVRILVDEMKADHFLFVNKVYDKLKRRFNPPKYFSDPEAAMDADVRVAPTWYVPVVVTDVKYGKVSLQKFAAKGKDPEEVKKNLLDGTVRFFEATRGTIDAFNMKFKKKKATSRPWTLYRTGGGEGNAVVWHLDSEDPKPLPKEMAALEVPNLLETLTMYTPTDDIDRISGEADTVQEADRELDFA